MPHSFPSFRRAALRRALPLAGLALLLGTPALAHDLVVKPGATADGKVPVEVLLTEVFFTGDVVLKPESVTVQAVEGGQKSPVAVAPDAAAKALAGSAPAAGPALVVAKIARTRPAREEAGRPPEPATLSESTSKALVNLAPGAAGFGTLSGDRLEIVPLANPAELKAGDELPLQVLFDGKPLPVRVFATHDGFSTREGTFATTAIGEKDGPAYVKITAPGLWVVKVSHTQAEDAPAHKRYSANSNLVFLVK
ncbi:MAG: DUF4198 domain-containing protein [Pseudomonadota bacterium]